MEDSTTLSNKKTGGTTDRDQHCQYHGCSKTHHLQVHHIVHWADGGVTSIDNGVDIRNRPSAIDNAASENSQCSLADSEDIRVSCAEPASGMHAYQVGGSQRLFIGPKRTARLITAEQCGRYLADRAYH